MRKRNHFEMDDNRKLQTVLTNTFNTKPMFLSDWGIFCFSEFPTKIQVHFINAGKGILTDRIVGGQRNVKPILSAGNGSDRHKQQFSPNNFFFTNYNHTTKIIFSDFIPRLEIIVDEKQHIVLTEISRTLRVNQKSELSPFQSLPQEVPIL